MALQTRIASALIALAAAVLPLGALAQNAAASGAPAPSYARTDESIKGRITSFDGAYSLQVRDEHGYVDNVQLHQGTVINPTGLRLSPGMDVTIYGVNRGPVFAANEIDTPYQTYDFAYGPYPYPYPVYAYPYAPFSFGVRIGRFRRW